MALTESRPRPPVGSTILFFLTLSIAACVVVSDPAGSGGMRLVGSGDIDPHGEQSFFLSPNDRYVFYKSNRGEALRPVYVVYELASRQAYDIGWSPTAAELAAAGRGPRPSTCRWNESERALVLEGDGQFFIARLGQAALEWEVAKSIEELRLAAQRLTGNDPGVALRQPSEREAVLIDATDPSRILVRHVVDEPGGTRVAIPHWTVSPDRRYLTYVVKVYRGSFVGPGRGFIVSLTARQPGPPRFLAAPVYGPLKWKADSSAFFACVRPGGEPSQLYQWPSPS